MKTKAVWIVTSVLAIMLTGCALFAPQEADLVGDVTPTRPVTLPTATLPILAPTLPPASEETASPPPEEQTAAAPTPLPEPTQIAPPTGEAETPLVPNIDVGSGPGISLSEQLGQPGETVVVIGSGFPPLRRVTLHWGPVEGPLGPLAAETVADAEGSFEISLVVPESAQWPGGSADELESIQLRAKSETWADTEYFWTNFRYVIRFNPVSSLVLPYTNTDYGYQVTVPNGWTWSWEEDDTSNVRFTGVGMGRGFVRVLSGTTVSAAIQTVMAAEAPGQSYTTGSAAYGAYPGTQATAANGLTVVFIERGGRVYALSFTDDNGQFFAAVIASFILS